MNTHKENQHSSGRQNSRFLRMYTYRNAMIQSGQKKVSPTGFSTNLTEMRHGSEFLLHMTVTVD